MARSGSRPGRPWPLRG
ncbi:MAG: phage DNA packaging protein J [Hyphomicrobium sp.]